MEKLELKKAEDWRIGAKRDLDGFLFKYKGPIFIILPPDLKELTLDTMVARIFQGEPKTEVWIGSASNNDLVLNYEDVESPHVSIIYSGNDVCIVDHSNSGTFVGDRKIKRGHEHPLRDHQEIAVGKAHLRYCTPKTWYLTYKELEEQNGNGR